eukprot:scaffold3416_cov76-Cyclotella_meneghiniana.AAC.3
MSKVPLDEDGNQTLTDKRDVQYAFENSWLWKKKLYLQHTGWLQYIPPFLFGNVCLLISQGLWYFSNANSTTSNLAAWSATIAKIFYTIGVFDILTIKLNILRPPEPLPTRLGLIKETCDAITIMQHRHSCRSFQPRKMMDKDREEILQISVKESKNTIGKSNIRFEYVSKPLNVWPCVNCQEFLVAIGPARYDRMAMIDVGKSLQKVVIHATMMGLGTCWIGPGADHNSIVAALGDDRYNSRTDHIVCVCAIGYKSTLFIPFALRIFNNVGRHRKPCTELFFADYTCRVPLDVATHPWDRYAKCYEAARWSPSSYNAQPTRAVGIHDGKSDTVRFDFFSSTTSKYYAPVAVGIWLCDWEDACGSIGVKGKFVVLTNQERSIDDPRLPELPVYNISWVHTPSS